MILRSAQNTLLTVTKTLQCYKKPLFFRKQICTSIHLNARRPSIHDFKGARSKHMRDFNGSSGLSGEEIDDLIHHDPEENPSGSLEELKYHVGNIDREAVKFQKFIQQKTIKHKYFKKYEPVEENLLTWEMKEQLKYLHHNDPDEWTPEALSVAFPISSKGAVKLLNSKWAPESEEEIERHDKAVIAKWRKYTNGRLGSAKLLEMLVNKRLGHDNEKLPAPVMDPEKMMFTLESLKFENEENPKPPSAETEKKLKPKKKYKLKSGSFVSIIEDYESKLSSKVPTQKNQETKESYHLDVNSVIPSTPEYEGTYSRMRSINSVRNTRRKGFGKKNLMTFEEFMRGKN